MKALYTLIFIFTCQVAVAQRHEISGSFGYGSSAEGRFFRELIVLPIGFGKTALLLGADYNLSLGKNDLFRLSAGTYLHHKSSLFLSYSHLYIPVGGVLDLGNKYHFFLGGGLNAKILLANDFHPSTSRNDLQWSWFYQFGLGYRVSDQLDLKLEIRTNVDINRFYLDQYTKGNGAVFFDNIYESEGILQLSIARTISKK